MTAAACIRRPHATWTTCRCETCAPEASRFRKRNRSGLAPARPSEQAWAVVDSRLAAGWSPAAIASAARLSERTIRGAIGNRATRGHHTWSRGIALALLAAPSTPMRGMVPALGSSRRLQALAALGWSLADLHAATGGVPVMTLSVVRSGRTTTARAQLATTIVDVYERLAMTPGPTASARERAIARGWVAPLAWDDDTIDDPAAGPAPAARARGVDLDEWLLLVRCGEHPRRAATRCGVSVSAIEQNARRHHRSDVLELVAGVRASERRAS